MDLDSIGGPIKGICLFAAYDYLKYPAYQDSLYLCNLTTREFRKIPDRPFGIQRARPSMFGFDYARFDVGFGYGHRTNEYKVVSIMLFLEDQYSSQTPCYGPLKIEIYSVSSNSWRVAGIVFPTINVHSEYPRYLNIGQEGMFWECGLFLIRSIHWHTGACIKANLIFNISDEVMLAFNLPRDVTIHQNDPRSLFVLDDSLTFVQRVMHQDLYYVHTASFYVWVMVEYGDEESWIKKIYLQPGIHMDVLTIWNDMLICETEEDGELVSCNLQENHFRKHHHIRTYPPELSNLQRIRMAAMVMRKQSLVRLR